MFCRWKSVLFVSLAGLGLAAAAHEEAGLSAGIEAHTRTTLADIGLPQFPGARPRVDGGQGDDKPAVSFGLWGGTFGLKIKAMKFASDAPPARVAAFYAKALSAHGEVLDCREPAARVKPPKGQPEKLACDSGAPAAGEFQYRVGTPRDFRVVSVKPQGEGARFDVVRIELRS